MKEITITIKSPNDIITNNSIQISVDGNPVGLIKKLDLSASSDELLANLAIEFVDLSQHEGMDDAKKYINDFISTLRVIKNINITGG